MSFPIFRKWLGVEMIEVSVMERVVSGAGAAVAMLVLYVLLPWLLRALAGPVAAGLALPLLGQGVVPVATAASHLALALWLLHGRWRATATGHGPV